jgi:Leucine-rich repeat (LRR) protein
MPSIPTAIKHLKELKLNCLELKNVPEELCELSQLEVLDLHYNRIEKMPNLSRLVNLNFLNLFINRLKEIKGLEHLTKLVHCKVS